MLHIVEWLEDVERSAAELYAGAAGRFAADRVFSAFLQRLAEEERWHAQLMRALLGNRDCEPEVEALITLDEETRANISSLFTVALNRIASGTMGREAMLETMVAAEFSEWNDIFLYVLHTLQGGGREYHAAVAEMERHKQEIVEFLAAEPDGGRYLETVRRLPAVAGKRILVVEKHQVLARLLRGILATVGEVELVETGPEGLARIEEGDFDVVISDINMPAMNSLEFYARVVSTNPEMKDRFVFFAGGQLQESLEAFSASEATVLTRPAMISYLRRTVAGIAHRSRVFH